LGFDAHRFSGQAERPLALALLEWPSMPPLDGHSDGDVAVHALVDALLSAAQLGDIGGLFGSDRPGFADAPSRTFLIETMRLLTSSGWTVENATVQIIGNRPRVASRRTEAQMAFEAIVGAPVTVSATTTDGMGFSGNDEGLAAIANCLLRRAGLAESGDEP
jgi:2-C-methyl-D-erythritol 2,4-cyclodiphosphate synthase